MDVAIYPNPSEGNFTIAVNSNDKTAVAEIEIVNEYGQPVYKTTMKNNNGVMVLNVNNKLTNGIYLVNCILNNQKMIKKLVINK